MARIKLRELDPNGTLNITGSLGVSGSFSTQLTEPMVLSTTAVGQPALIVSGALEIVRAQVQNQIVSASLTIQNLGTLADRSSSETIDLGGFF